MSCRRMVKWKLVEASVSARDSQLDYNPDFGREAGLFDTTSPFRVSDHDPVIIGLIQFTLAGQN